MRNILRNTWKVLHKNEKSRFRLLILMDIIISIADIFFLALLLWIIQFYIQPGIKTRSSFLPAWLLNRNSAGLIAGFFFLFLIKNICGYLVTKSYYKFAGDVAVRISRDNLVRYQQSGFEEFINVDSSVQIRKIAFQPFEFCQHILSGIQQVFTQGCLVAITVIAILLFNARLFLLLFVILLPPVLLVFYYIKKRLSKTKKNIQTDNEKSFRYLTDALKGYVESNIYDRNDFFTRRFVDTRKKFSIALFESISLQNMPSRIIELFAVMGLFILIAIAKWSNYTDSSSLITVGAFMAAAYKIIPGLVRIINVTGQMKAYEFSANDLVNSESNIIAKPPKAFKETIDSMQLKDISFSYAGSAPVLINFNLMAMRGDFIGISGQSGKGKTTILNLLLGFLIPERGEVLFNAKKVGQDEIKNYWSGISYVRQQPFLIHDSILKNITLDESACNNEKLEQIFQTTGLKEFIETSPEGIEKIISENGKNISGGQQQRIALARALYKDADLILLDEPFNELDGPSVILLLEHFKKLSQAGKTVIMITHDKTSLSYCDKLISLDEQG